MDYLKDNKKISIHNSSLIDLTRQRRPREKWDPKYQRLIVVIQCIDLTECITLLPLLIKKFHVLDRSLYMILNILAKCLPIMCVCQNYFLSNTTATVELSYFAYLGQFASYRKFLGAHIQCNIMAMHIICTV